jgi:hypothetical protein
LTYTFEPAVTNTETVLHITVRFRSGQGTYDVVKDWTGRFRHPAEFHGAVLPDCVELNAENALVHPKLSDDANLTVHFGWRKLPTAWVLATSFGVG